jgi:metal-responsive CopG/Arc/MetJ family transcriptional regulator
VGSSNPAPCRRDAGSANLAIPMSDLSRIGVAIDASLLKKFDQLVGNVGATRLVYDHQVHLWNEKPTDLQHPHFHSVLPTVHVATGAEL